MIQVNRRRHKYVFNRCERTTNLSLLTSIKTGITWPNQSGYKAAHFRKSKSGTDSSETATAKTQAMNELYEELETPEGERKIYRIAKAKDFTNNNQIKDEQRIVLRDLDRIVGRWKGYFDKLLNGENHRFDSEDLVPNDGLRQ